MGLEKLARRIWQAVPEKWRHSAVGRLLRACRHLPDNDWFGLRIARARFERATRLRLAAAGLPLARRLLVYRCEDGRNAMGLFAEFRVILGLLAHYEEWKDQYAGVRVDFATAGLFYDPPFGPNWWEYYFEPIAIGSCEGAEARLTSALENELLLDEEELFSKERRAELVARHIRPKPHVRDKVDAYVRDNFQDAFVIGIHYRGTNKSEEANRVPYRDVYAAALQAISSAGSARCRLFLATDEQAFLDYLREKFPDTLLHRELFRSRDGRPIDEVNEDGNYRKGEDAVIDCLLLARCQMLVRTESNLSVCSTLFNPALPDVCLNRRHGSP